MAGRKIVFVIVEGPSDEDAIGTLLNRVYSDNTVYVYVVHGDITSKLSVNPGNVVREVGKLIRKYAGNTFRSSDFERIIHITDTDGVFIPDDRVIEDTSAKEPLYSTTGIRTRNKHGIESRNSRKRENLMQLAETPEIWRVPYQIYFMSCNLDHALYGKLNSTDAEKEYDSIKFAERYRSDVPAFIRFISESDFSVMGSYPESWSFIREELHSLERHTNLGICFAGDKETE